MNKIVLVIGMVFVLTGCAHVQETSKQRAERMINEQMCSGLCRLFGAESKGYYLSPDDKLTCQCE